MIYLNERLKEYTNNIININNGIQADKAGLIGI